MNASAVVVLGLVVAAGFALRWIVLWLGGRINGLTQTAITVTAAVVVAHIWNSDPGYPASVVGTILIGGFAAWLFHSWR